MKTLMTLFYGLPRLAVFATPLPALLYVAAAGFALLSRKRGVWAVLSVLAAVAGCLAGLAQGATLPELVALLCLPTVAVLWQGGDEQ